MENLYTYPSHTDWATRGIEADKKKIQYAMGKNPAFAQLMEEMDKSNQKTGQAPTVGIDFSSKGDAELTPEQIADLQSRYDMDNLDIDSLESLLGELTQMGVVSGKAAWDLLTMINDGTSDISIANMVRKIMTKYYAIKCMLERMEKDPLTDLKNYEAIQTQILELNKLLSVLKDLGIAL